MFFYCLIHAVKNHSFLVRYGWIVLYSKYKQAYSAISTHKRPSIWGITISEVKFYDRKRKDHPSVVRDVDLPSGFRY